MSYLNMPDKKKIDKFNVTSNLRPPRRHPSKHFRDDGIIENIRKANINFCAETLKISRNIEWKE
jgi:hypothetical protein